MLELVDENNDQRNTIVSQNEALPYPYCPWPKATVTLVGVSGAHLHAAADGGAHGAEQWV